ncbi:DUF6455 family protein [Roseovarius salinarum]|uniref:DUF6455 family protein n=1 Tax=Roseovarius salinarum TaxID=1981892 RepID=UPI000C3294B3|nr:DUF6455 family protein [Roseovarius salinarum]
MSAERLKPLGPPRRHYWLLKRMARATGTDLVRARHAGSLDGPDWAEMVQRCRGCGWAGGCARWLRAEPHREVPPHGCANRARLARLKIDQVMDR